MCALEIAWHMVKHKVGSSSYNVVGCLPDEDSHFGKDVFNVQILFQKESLEEQCVWTSSSPFSRSKFLFFFSNLKYLALEWLEPAIGT